MLYHTICVLIFFANPILNLTVRLENLKKSSEITNVRTTSQDIEGVVTSNIPKDDVVKAQPKRVLYGLIPPSKSKLESQKYFEKIEEKDHIDTDLEKITSHEHGTRKRRSWFGFLPHPEPEPEPKQAEERSDSKAENEKDYSGSHHAIRRSLEILESGTEFDTDSHLSKDTHKLPEKIKTRRSAGVSDNNINEAIPTDIGSKLELPESRVEDVEETDDKIVSGEHDTAKLMKEKFSLDIPYLERDTQSVLKRTVEDNIMLKTSEVTGNDNEIPGREPNVAKSNSVKESNIDAKVLHQTEVEKDSFLREEEYHKVVQDLQNIFEASQYVDVNSKVVDSETASPIIGSIIKSSIKRHHERRRRRSVMPTPKPGYLDDINFAEPILNPTSRHRLRRQTDSLPKPKTGLDNSAGSLNVGGVSVTGEMLDKLAMLMRAAAQARAEMRRGENVKIPTFLASEKL